VLWQDRERASADVKAVALSHVGGLQAKIAELQAMVQTLEHLAAHCHGNDRPDCPIIADLAQPVAAPAETASATKPRKTPLFGADTPVSSRGRAPGKPRS